MLVLSKTVLFGDWYNYRICSDFNLSSKFHLYTLFLFSSFLYHKSCFFFC